MSTGDVARMGRVITTARGQQSPRGGKMGSKLNISNLKKWVIIGFHRVNEIFPLQECYAASLVVTDVSGQPIVPSSSH